jgi:hypothetical protein
MTDHRLAGELPGRQRARTSDGRDPSARPRTDDGRENRPGRSAAPSLSEVLSLCDRHLDEVGRRNHLFGWLRPPGAGADEWLPVDAYYPRNRLVVLYRPRARPHDQIYRELIPEHGLRLLALSPDELGTTAAGTERALAALLAHLDPAPAPAGPPPARASTAPDLWTKVSSRATAALQGATKADRPASPRGNPDGEASPRRSPHGEVSPRRSANGEASARRSADGEAPPSAAARAERFLATRSAYGTRRAHRPASAESPLAGIAVGVILFLVLLVAVLYIVSNAG